MRYLWTAAVGAAVVAVSSMALGEDWLQWRGPGRTGISAEKGLLQQWPEGGPKLLWAFGSLGEGYSIVSVAGDTIYTTGKLGADGYLFAISLDGKLKWKTKYGPEWAGRYPGARSTPTIDGNRAYVMSGRLRVVCVDAKTAEEKWAVDAVEKFGGKILKFGNAESLLIDGDNVISTPGGPDATMVALHKLTGETVWQTRGLSHESAYCSPILIERGNTRLIATMTKQAVVGVAADTGQVLWQHPYTSRYGVHALTPVYQADTGYLYFGSSSGGGGGMLKLSADGKSMSLGWYDKALTCHHGGAILLDGHVYQSSRQGQWACLALGSGKAKYEVPGIGRGALAYADGMLYCYSEKGDVCLVKPTPAGYEIASSFKMSKGTAEHWAHPAIVDGRLYIRHGNTLAAFGVRE